MTDLLLREGEQRTVRAVIALEPVPGAELPGEAVLALLRRLIECDACGIALLDDTGFAVEQAAPRPGQDPDDDQSTGDAPVVLGIECRGRRPSREWSRAARAVAVLTLGVRNGPHHVVKLWMVRRATDFSDRDRALLALVAPALERLLRERPTANQPSLTVQERRVLHHVGLGLSTAEIAQRLVVAPCTVSKHLEHAYRKLGVTNRVAAVHALQGERRPDTDVETVGRAESFV
ncbi:MAG TPA: helix-turn-helix transcriptional regulator [Ornithinibacter sp.]|nr:helix-turn-helix transcriptional regulator [Ornithinibacter sp.]